MKNLILCGLLALPLSSFAQSLPPEQDYSPGVENRIDSNTKFNLMHEETTLHLGLNAKFDEIGSEVLLRAVLACKKLLTPLTGEKQVSTRALELVYELEQGLHVLQSVTSHRNFDGNSPFSANETQSEWTLFYNEGAWLIASDAQKQLWSLQGALSSNPRKNEFAIEILKRIQYQ